MPSGTKADYELNPTLNVYLRWRCLPAMGGEAYMRMLPITGFSRGLVIEVGAPPYVCEAKVERMSSSSPQI